MEEDSEIDVICHSFKHQIGGHKCVLQISENLICKPCEEAERVFYNNVPGELKPYVPCYRGEVTVRCEENRGSKVIHAKVPNSVLKKQRRCSENNESDDVSWSRSRLDHCIEEGSLWKNNSSEKFIMFDNLVAHFDRPCALDIKLCRYYHGQCSDEKKRLKLEQKSNNSTSLSLGFRICGMQIYEPETRKLQKYNKYHGMSLNDDQAIELLREFFSNSCGESIRDMSKTIRNIHNAILNQTDFVFLSVSLFFFYDNHKPPQVTSLVNPVINDCKVKEPGCQVRLIDFEKTVLTTDNEVNLIPQHIRENINFGMTNLTNIMDRFAVDNETREGRSLTTMQHI